MPKCWGKQIFSLGRFLEVGHKQKTEKEKKREERPKVGNYNGQLGIVTPPRVANAKPPGPIITITGMCQAQGNLGYYNYQCKLGSCNHQCKLDSYHYQGQLGSFNCQGKQ